MIIFWVLLVGALVCVLPIARVVLRTFAADHDGYELETTDYVMATALAIPVAMLWPMALLGYLVYRALRKETV